MKDTQSRKWCLTINNPVDHNMGHDMVKEVLQEFKSLVYWCMCDEIGAEGTYHTHLYFCCKNGVRFSVVKKKFPSAYMRMANGTSQENRDYIRKEGKHEKTDKKATNLADTFEEFGDMPLDRPGQRNDLVDLYDSIKDGASNYDILEENPTVMMSIDKVDRVRQILKEEEFKRIWRDLEVTYIWGPSQSGKTRMIMEQYGYENVYRVTDYLHPFDGYSGQDVIIFEEFRSSLRVSEMLNYLDGYPLSLPARYLNKVACYTKVYLISNEPLEEQYKEIQKEVPATWRAFRRRIGEVIEKKNSEGEFTQLRIDMEDDYVVPF